MRIKEVSLLGYKSFATRTRLVFPPGLTAIVGPNGSGKSNVSDAVRWVLGEGRSSALRARSADEMIFAGSEKRARGGLAEVSLTIDNADGWLDLDFPEVVITRRAERDGQPHYQINGSRVRLRDVLDLLGGRLGHSSYTVIGQGLVDQFLTMRPDQRRTLIDEAAGITPIQRRRDRSVRKLDDTRDNLTRVQDILSEIGPRLRRMERLSGRAARHREVNDELRASLESWYGFQIHRARETLTDARARAADLLDERSKLGLAVTAAEAARQEAELAAQAAESSSAAVRAERDRTAGEIAARREAAAIARTRLEALSVRVEELATGVERHEREHNVLEERRAALEHEVGALDAEHAEQTKALAEARLLLETESRKEEEASAAREAARAEHLAMQGIQAGRRARIEALDVEIAARRAEWKAAEERRAGLEKALASREAEFQAAENAWRAADEAVRSIAAESAAAEQGLRAATEQLAAAQEAAAQAGASLESLRARANALDALFTELGAGEEVLEPLRASGDLRLVGAVAELLQIPPAWEQAAAAALGGTARGIVVRDDASVEQALTLIDPAQAAGLTLVPLDNRADAPWSPVEGENAAATLVGDADAPGLARLLLADVAFVADRDAARAAVRRNDGPRVAVTANGDRITRGGMLTLASISHNVLGIARERRDLPASIEAAAGARESARAEVERIGEERRGFESTAGTLATRRAELDRARDDAAAARDSAEVLRGRANRDAAWLDESIARLREEHERAVAERASSMAEMEADAKREAELSAAVSAGAPANSDSAIAAARAMVTERSAALAATNEGLAARRARLEAAMRDAQAARERAADARRRGEAIAKEMEGLRNTSAAEASPEAAADPLTTAVQAVQASEEGLRAARDSARDASGALEEIRRRVASLDERLGEARLSVARAEDRLERLADQISADAEILPLPEDAPRQVTMGELTGFALPVVTELPSDLEHRIARLRRELRAIGAIDHEALAAYEETAERHRFLTDQSADLVTAEHDLREAIQTLEREMAERFDATFDRVAQAFQTYFPLLFGGGEAELTFLADDVNDDGDENSTGAGNGSAVKAGIDILARPPGKRRQPLSLLSGGERAITAVALLFALLEVSGTPFVVLDEVDAALDEANVDRFRGCLETLAERVQVVIITHNRATVQSAGTVYGVTMGEDGASRTVSLRVDEAA